MNLWLCVSLAATSCDGLSVDSKSQMGIVPSEAVFLSELGENSIRCIPGTGNVSVTLASDGTLLGTNPVVILSTVPTNAIRGIDWRWVRAPDRLFSQQITEI